MTEEQLKHILSQTQLGIERDEAEAKQRLAAANEKRELLGVIESLYAENQQLLANQHVHNSYHIEQLNGNYIENINQANLCPPSSISSTEPISNTSTPTSKTNITLLLNQSE